MKKKVKTKGEQTRQGKKSKGLNIYRRKIGDVLRKEEREEVHREDGDKRWED